MNGVTVPFKNTEIAWSTDKDVKFQNPDDAANCIKFYLFV
jgi:hypothetical protein